MNLRLALALAIVITCSPALAERPDTLIILSDDQGYGELSCHGKAIPISQARIRIGSHYQTANASGERVTFTLSLERGPVELQATFLDAEGKPLLGAYYAYIRRL